MMRRMNRKGDELDFMMLVVMAVLLAIMGMVVMAFTNSYIKKETDTRDAEARIIAERFIYSPGCIAYYDADIGKAYTGAVDASRLNSAVLDLCMSIDSNQMAAAKISLTDARGIAIGEAFYNRMWYERWEPLAGKKGSGGAGQVVEQRYVLVYDKGKFVTSGMLVVKVLVPNA